MTTPPPDPFRNRDIRPPILRRTEGGGGEGEGSFRAEIFNDSIEDYIRRTEEHNAAYFAGQAQENKEEQERKRLEMLAQLPRAIEAGPMEFTSNVGVEVWPTIVWDVNGYYASLRVHWRASRSEIREAYQNNGGPESERLTYIVKQLLNPFVRANYDATQPGSVFFDKYIAEYVREKMLQDHVKETGSVAPLEDRMAEQQEVVDFTQYMDKSMSMVDSEGEGPEALPEGQRRWRWGFYLWHTEIYDIERLRQWQELLIAALAEREAIVRFSVGLIGGTAVSIRVEPVGYRVVAFLGDTQQPTAEIASDAADRVLQTVANMATERVLRI